MTLELELSKEFEETVESVALHPTGKWGGNQIMIL